MKITYMFVFQSTNHCLPVNDFSAGSVDDDASRLHCPRAGPRPSGPRADPGPALKGQGRGQPFLIGSALGRPWLYSIPNIVGKHL